MQRVFVALVCLAFAAEPSAAAGRVFFSSGNLQGSYSHAYKPSYIAFGSNSYITGLHWRGWNQRQPHSMGTLQLNNCTPNCAQGTVTSWRVSVVLSRIRRCGGVKQYLTMRFHYVAASPPGYPRRYRQNFGRFCD